VKTHLASALGRFLRLRRMIKEMAMVMVSRVCMALTSVSWTDHPPGGRIVPLRLIFLHGPYDVNLIGTFLEATLT